MIGKSIRVATLFAAAAGIPYVWFNPQVSGRVKSLWNDWKSRSEITSTLHEDSSAYDSSFHSDERIIPVAPSAATRRAANQPIPLQEITRFDISPRWVTEHWDRVSTFRSEDDLEALRVSLVTGTDVSAVTGSLTYYFDRHQQVRRITVHGHTGDDRPLTELATERFKLRQEAALGAGLYLARWNGKPTSVLRVSHAPVMRTTTPYTKFRIYLELNRPHNGYTLSSTGQTALNYNGS